ncbi:PEP-CTERM sorting domain-containing protein [Herbaspirillum sp. SJZ107]|uniref:PEP-CTERM sorting domain-containing protein n=1 Tax=Herbaspirillum sp. SJZ107 TaxID=2572881 RepID=UPI0011517322|nr:PEP-CTERM sorting domain-containing protein [Herbaspirillum sp. SJZ107]TQK11004.1 putative secreted protein with PEP-CTERM sorting signal [Herbaspirillum sp. SJZ107]
MNHRTAYIRRSREGLRLKKRVLAVALLGVAACAGVLLEGNAPLLHARSQEGVFAADASARPADAVTAGTAAVAAGPRRIYPYSIVAGGVAGRAELAHVIQTDKVVAAHYASFEVAKAHPVAVAKPRAVHVSYRKGDQVFWTAKKVMLAEGETLLSDGKSEIRGRCGNRISDVAMLPVEAGAPSEEELDAAVDDGGDGGPLQVAAPFAGEGGRYAHQLLSFPNGAGLLAVTGGEGWHPPGGFPGGVPSGSYPGPSYGTPTVVTGGSSALVGSTSDPGKLPTQTGSAGGSTSETPRGTSPADTAPAPVAAPIELADTVQPEPEPAVPAPTLPGTVLSPVAPPAIPVATLEPTAEAPEPASLWLGGVGMAAMLLLRRRPGRRA